MGAGTEKGQTDLGDGLMEVGLISSKKSNQIFIVTNQIVYNRRLQI